MSMTPLRTHALALLSLAAFLSPPLAIAQLPTGWKAHDLTRPAPKVVTAAEAPGGAPSDAMVLFDGSDLSQWRAGDGGDSKWKVVDGAMESVAGAGYIFTKREFGDCQLHIEWASPQKVKGDGQGRGNSGVFLMGLFEIQVLDSFENPTYSDGSAGSLYGQYPPLVNASRGPGQWQTYDIIFRAPRFEDGKLTSPARATVLHNGVLIQDGSEAFGPTAWIVHNNYTKQTKGPIGLQDHGNPVRFRNVWIRELRPRAPRTETYPVEQPLSDELAAKVVGEYGPYKVAQRDGKLQFWFRNRAEWLELVHEGDGKFGFRKTAGSLTFEFGDDGVPKSLTAHVDAAGTHRGDRKK